MTFSDPIKEQEIKDKIKELIASGEHKRARIFLEDYKESKYPLSEHYLDIEAAENKARFDKAIDGHNSKTAREALEALRGKIQSHDYADLETRIKNIESKHIITYLNSITYEPSKEEAIKKFLDSNPESKDRLEVIEYLLARKFVKIEDNFKNEKQTFEGLFNDLLNLNDLLERYQNEGANLLEVVDMNKFTRMTTDYLSKELIKKSTTERIIIGKTVRFKSISFFNSYITEYWTPRNNLIPINSLGKVVSMQGSDVFVLFENFKDNSEWNVLARWNSEVKKYLDLNQKVAAFKPRELQVVELYNEIEKNTVRKELSRTNELFSKFYFGAKTTEKTSSETAKQGINELVSQDFPK